MKITKILNNINNSIWEKPYRNIRSSGFYGHIYDYLHTVGKDLHSKYSNLYDAPWIAVKEFTSYNNGKVVLLKLFFRAQEYNKNYNVLSYDTFLGSFYGTMFWLMNLLTLSTTYYKARSSDRMPQCCSRCHEDRSKGRRSRFGKDEQQPSYTRSRA